MSNLWLNWRFGAYHLQIANFNEWGCWLKNRSVGIRWSPRPACGLYHNPYQAANAMTLRRLFSRKAWGEWFEVM